MNILIVSQYYWPEGFLITGLAEELQQRGFTVTVLTGFPNYPNGKFFQGYRPWKGPLREERRGVKIIRLPITPRGQNFFTLSINYISFVISGCIFSFFTDFKKTDLIFCYAPSPATSCLTAVFLKWRLNKKLIFWVQDLWPESLSAVGALSSSIVQKIVGRVICFIYRRCDKILISNEGFKESVLNWGGHPEQIEFVPNWADPFPAEIEPSDWVKALPKGFRIAFAGNLGKAQDLPNLVAAAEILKDRSDIKWIVVGDGSEKQWLEETVKNKNLQETIFVLDRKPYEQMLPFFKSADLLYVSLNNHPLFALTVPAKVQAYMSAGKPILASLNGEGKRLIEKARCGQTSQPEDPENLSQVVLSMKKLSESEREKMGQNGKDYFLKHFEKKKVIDRIESLIL